LGVHFCEGTLLSEGSRFFAFAKIAPLLKAPDEGVMFKKELRCFSIN